MKIGMCLFEITKIGGISTVEENLEYGLKENGHNVSHFYLSPNKKKLGESPIPFIKNVLGYMTDDMVNNTINVLSDFDVLIFDPPCPTITRSFSSTNWQKIYKSEKLTDKKIIISHDPYLRKYYPWILDVKDRIFGVGAIQNKGYTAFSKYFSNIVITNHFIDTSDIGLYPNLKEDLVISPHQFKTWKHIDLFIRSVPHIKYNIEVYNGGIEHCYMSGEKRKEKYRNKKGEWIWDNAIDHGMEYLGFVDDILTPFKRSKCIVDLSVGEHGSILSKQGSYKSLNYVPIEAMKYASIPIVRDYSLLDDIITEDNVLLVDEKDIVKSTASLVNEAINNYDSYSDMIDRNFDVVKKNFDRKSNAKKLLSLLDGKPKHNDAIQSSLF